MIDSGLIRECIDFKGEVSAHSIRIESKKLVNLYDTGSQKESQTAVLQEETSEHPIVAAVPAMQSLGRTQVAKQMGSFNESFFVKACVFDSPPYILLSCFSKTSLCFTRKR